METVKVEVNVPKELNDVRTLIVELVKDIVAKKTATEIGMENLPLLIAAIDGFDKFVEEIKGEEVFNLGALLGADIAKVFLAKKEVVAEPQA